jgi:hypothetical protein
MRKYDGYACSFSRMNKRSKKVPVRAQHAHQRDQASNLFLAQYRCDLRLCVSACGGIGGELSEIVKVRRNLVMKFC